MRPSPAVDVEKLNRAVDAMMEQAQNLRAVMGVRGESLPEPASLSPTPAQASVTDLANSERRPASDSSAPHPIEPSAGFVFELDPGEERPSVDALFHRLWTKYAALPNYVKAEWTAAYNEIWMREKIAPRDSGNAGGGPSRREEP